MHLLETDLLRVPSSTGIYTIVAVLNWTSSSSKPSSTVLWELDSREQVGVAALSA